MSGSYGINEKEMLKLFRSILTRLSKLKLEHIQVKASIDFGLRDSTIELTIFNEWHKNKTLWIYDHSDLDRAEIRINKLIKEIKTDDFDNIDINIHDV